MRIQVTQEHIDRGERRNSRYCPIALAIKGQGHTSVRVSHSSAIVKSLAAIEIWYNLSKPTSKFIQDFDDNRPVLPSMFIAKKSKFVRFP